MTTAAVRRCLSELVDPPDPRTDAELLTGYATGADGRAFAALVRRHGPVVLAVCRRALGGPDADDAFQAVFLQLARRAGTLRDPRALPAWLHRVAVRVARRALARRRPTAPLPGDLADPADPLGGVIWRDLRRVLDEELDRLPERLRAPLVLCLLDGLPRDEAAARLGCSLNTVRRRIDAGRERLRAQLTRRGVGPLALALAALDGGGLRAVVPPALGAAAVRLGGGRAGVAPVVAALAADSPPRLLRAFTLVSVVLVAGSVAAVATPHPSAQPPVLPTAVLTPNPVPPDFGALPAGAVRRFADDRFRHPGGIVAAAVSADGRRVATLSPQVLQIADLATGLPFRRIPIKDGEHGYYSTPGLAFSPDGRFVACALNDKLTAAWETDTGREVFRRPERKAGWALCQFTADGKLVLQDSGRLRFLDVPSGKEVAGRAVGGATQLSRDGTVFVEVEKERERVALGDAVTGKVAHRLAVSTAADGSENGLALSPDGRRLAVVHDRREVQVWDAAAGTKTAAFPIPDGAVVKGEPAYMVGFSADGAVVLLGTSAGTVHRWQISPAKELPALHVPLGRRVRLMHPTADGRTLVTADGSGAVTRWDVATGTRVGSAAGYNRSIHVCVVPAGKQLVVADHAGRIDLWDATTGTLVRTVAPAGRTLTALDVSPDGRQLAVGETGGVVRLVQLADGAAKQLHAGTPKAGVAQLVRFSPDGKLLLAADWGKEMRVIDLVTGGVLWTGDTVSAAAFTPNGRLIWGQYKTLTVADARTGDVVREVQVDLPAGDDFFNSSQSIAVSPDGRRIACAVLGGQVAVFDSVARPVLRFTATDRRYVSRPWKFPGPAHYPLESLAFSPDGRWLLTGGWDRSVRVWEAETGRAVRRFDGHLEYVRQVAFTPDGRSAVSAGADGAAYLWDLRPAPPNPGGL
jgi:RNA polymerase sigma factor (sigma-70 family)